MSLDWAEVFCSWGATDGAGVGATVEVNTSGEDFGLAVAEVEGDPPAVALLGSDKGNKISFALRTGVADTGVAVGEGAAAAIAFGFAVWCLKVNKAANPMTTSTASAPTARRLVTKILEEFLRRRTPLDRFFARVLKGKR